MAARFERKEYDPGVPLWVGKYKNLHNLPHWHMENEIIACREGEAELMLDGDTLHLAAGLVAIVPSGSVHNIDAAEESTLLVIQVVPELTAFLGDIHLRNPIFPDKYGFTDGIEEILGELNDRKPYYPQRATAVLTRLVIDVFRNEETVPAAEGGSRSKRIVSQYRELLERIDRESEFLTFSDAAAGMHMSEAHFSRFFKSFAGMTFSKYLNLVKIDKAVEIMRKEPEISTSDLALRCGFNTLRTFNRVFFSVTGYSPRQLPPDFTLHIRQFAVSMDTFDPTLGDTVSLE